MKQKAIYILNGEDAVNEYNENGAKGCKKKGFNDAVKIEYDKKTDSVSSIVIQVLNAVSGALDSILITEQDYKTITK